MMTYFVLQKPHYSSEYVLSKPQLCLIWHAIAAVFTVIPGFVCFHDDPCVKQKQQTDNKNQFGILIHARDSKIRVRVFLLRVYFIWPAAIKRKNKLVP